MGVCMNQSKISETIKKIRKENKLTQKQLADKLNVTYQAVSKWENGLNIPDITILKEICTEFNIDINDLLDNKINNKKKNIKIISVSVLIIFILVLISISLFHRDDNYFKKTTSVTNEFTVDGSIASINNNTYINITSIVYNIEDNTIYDSIKATLYENYNNENIKIADCKEEGKNITLNDHLKDVKFNIDDYKTNCKNEPNLYIEIKATKNNILTSYKIGLNLDDVCDND